MKNRSARGFRTALLGLAVLFASNRLFTSNVQADSFTDQRVKSGIRIFRLILKGDGDIAAKKGGDGSLTVVLVAAENASRQRFTDLLAEVTGSGERATVAGMPVSVQVLSAAGLDGCRASIGGLFVAEPLSDDQLKRAVQFGVDHHVVTFSPFEGDVEKGVLCGLSVQAKLAPFINTKTLKASGIAMSPMLLKNSVFHE